MWIPYRRHVNMRQRLRNGSAHWVTHMSTLLYPGRSDVRVTPSTRGKVLWCVVCRSVGYLRSGVVFVRELVMSSRRADTGGGAIFGSSSVDWIEVGDVGLVARHLPSVVGTQRRGEKGGGLLQKRYSFMYCFLRPQPSSFHAPRSLVRVQKAQPRADRSRHLDLFGIIIRGANAPGPSQLQRRNTARGPVMVDDEKRNTSRMGGEWVEGEDRVRIVLRWRVCAKDFRTGKVARHQPA